MHLWPNIVTLEISRTDRGGLPLLRSLRRLLLGENFIVITLNDGRVCRKQAASEGASGFVSKAHLARELPQLLTKDGRMHCVTSDR